MNYMQILFSKNMSLTSAVERHESKMALESASECQLIEKSVKRKAV